MGPGAGLAGERSEADPVAGESGVRSEAWGAGDRVGARAEDARGGVGSGEVGAGDRWVAEVGSLVGEGLIWRDGSGVHGIVPSGGSGGSRYEESGGQGGESGTDRRVDCMGFSVDGLDVGDGVEGTYGKTFSSNIT